MEHPHIRIIKHLLTFTPTPRDEPCGNTADKKVSRALQPIENEASGDSKEAIRNALY
jgi:hypothetical protein